MMPELPALVYEVLEQQRGRGGAVEREHFERLEKQQRHQHRTQILVLAGGALVVAAAVTLGLQYNPYASQSAIPEPGWILAGIGGWLLWRAFARRHPG